MGYKILKPPWPHTPNTSFKIQEVWVTIYLLAWFISGNCQALKSSESFYFDWEGHAGKGMALTVPSGFICQLDPEFLQPTGQLTSLTEFLFSMLTHLHEQHCVVKVSAISGIS